MKTFCIPLTKSIFRQSYIYVKKIRINFVKNFLKKKYTRIYYAFNLSEEWQPLFEKRPVCELISLIHFTFNIYHSGQNGDGILTPVEITELQDSAKKWVYLWVHCIVQDKSSDCNSCTYPHWLKFRFWYAIVLIEIKCLSPVLIWSVNTVVQVECFYFQWVLKKITTLEPFNLEVAYDARNPFLLYCVIFIINKK